MEEGFAMSAPLPSVSTGTSLSEVQLYHVTITWRGKRETRLFGPDDLASLRDRIDNPRMRLYVAGYLILRDGNRCSIRSPFCIQGEAPFEHPESADFDHINGNRKDHHLRNLRLACPRCNTHLQWKQKAAATSSQIRERKGDGLLDELPEVVRTNRANRPVYERWLADNSPMSVYDAIYAGARYLQEKHGNGSPQATRNYLKTVTAGNNPPFIIEEGRVRKA